MSNSNESGFYPFDLERARAGDEIVTKEGWLVSFVGLDKVNMVLK